MVCTAGGSPYAGYLLKYSAGVRDKMMHNIPCAGTELKRGTMVKKPGDAAWITLADPGALQILAGTDPNHPSATPTQISP